MTKPEVTVLLPVYNASTYLRVAVDSILNQTFKNFELLAIDDGSNDDSLAILLSYTDSRIRIITHDVNKGLITTLNEGLKIANGNYIVRMDADDVSLPHRIEKQVQFMNTHKQVAVAGAWFKDIAGKIKVSKTPTNHHALKAYLFFSCGLAHPTVIIRKEIFDKQQLFYNTHFPHAEDYELWVRVAREAQLANIPNVLLHYRYHQNQVSTVYNDVQRNSMHHCHRLQLAELGLTATEKELQTHFAIANLLFVPQTSFVKEAEQWLLKIIEANEQTLVFSPPHFKKLIGAYWYNICSTLFEQGLDTRKDFAKSLLVKRSCVSTNLQLKFKMKYNLGLMNIVQQSRKK